MAIDVIYTRYYMNAYIGEHFHVGRVDISPSIV